MSVIVIYLDEPEKYGKPLNTQRRIDAYSDLCFELEAHGADAYIARSPDSYQGNGLFAGLVFRFNDKRELEEVTEPVTASVIFDKGDRSTLPIDGFKKINAIEIDALCNSKIETARTFAEISPVTAPVEEYANLSDVLDMIPGVQKVFKPSDGFGGEGIIIGTSEEILHKATDTDLFPALVQEFIDTSSGVPGVIEGVHDIRVIIINGEILQFSVRQPSDGSLLANVQQGGSIVAIPLEDTPQEIREFAQQVDQKFEHFPHRIYSVDMVYDGTSYRLIELNARPGWHPVSFGEEAKRFVQTLAQMLLSATKH